MQLCLKNPFTSYREPLKTEAMKNALPDDGEHFVKIQDSNWRHGNHRGQVRATLPIASHEHFRELAILVQSGTDNPRYAARIAGTDAWAYFRHLQPWMHPIVCAYLDTLETYGHVVEMIEKTHQITHGNH